MIDLQELARRCEEARGADRELSAAVALAVHDWLHEVPGNKPLNCRLRNANNSPVYIGGLSTDMDYTSSLDAAMSLVPWAWLKEGGYRIGIEQDDFSDSWIARFDQLGDECGHGETILAEAATPALALTAACLRARAHPLPEERGR